MPAPSTSLSWPSLSRRQVVEADSSRKRATLEIVGAGPSFSSKRASVKNGLSCSIILEPRSTHGKSPCQARILDQYLAYSCNHSARLPLPCFGKSSNSL